MHGKVLLRSYQDHFRSDLTSFQSARQSVEIAVGFSVSDLLVYQNEKHLFETRSHAFSSLSLYFWFRIANKIQNQRITWFVKKFYPVARTLGIHFACSKFVKHQRARNDRCALKQHILGPSDQWNKGVADFRILKRTMNWFVFLHFHDRSINSCSAMFCIVCFRSGDTK